MTIYIVETFRLIIVFTLFFAAYGKIFSFVQFSTNLNESFNVPVKWSKLVTVIVILIEVILLAIILDNGEMTYKGMASVLILFILFTLLLTSSLYYGKVIRCNCFGQSNDKVTFIDIIRNLVLIIICVYYLFYYMKPIHNLTIQIPLSGIALASFLILTNLAHVKLMMKDPQGSTL